MNIIEKLSELFARFPGIGERQSKRFVYFLLHVGKGYREELARAIRELGETVNQCSSCFVYFESNGNTLCEICRNPNTSTERILVVEKDSDYEAMKRSKIFDGKLFVLGGLIPPIEKDIERYIRIRELEKIIETRSKDSELKEIILALSLTPSGERTDDYIRTILGKKITELNITLTSLGRGLSTGTEIEYSDQETIKNALENRK